MTQSGQGEEPSARPAREGVVLPSDGGEPLLPGVTAGPAGPGGAGGYPAGPPSASAPAGGRTWGGPWGPEQQSPAPPPGQGWQSPPDPRWGAQGQQAAWGAQNPSGPPAGGPGPGPLPPEGAPHPAHGGSAPYGGHGGAPMPQPGAGYGGQAGPGAPLPPENAYGAPAANAYGAPPAGGPLPPVSPEGATQYLPPVPGAPAAPDGAEGATQFLPPVPAAGVDEGATQYIPPVDPGALPPETPAGHDPETTRFLGRPRQGAPGAGAGPLPSAGHPDAEATQYIAPVTDPAAGPAHGAPPGDGERQPPAEFDNLFRDGGGDPAGSTQQLPRVGYEQPGHAAPPPPSGPGGGRRASYGGDGGRGGGRGRTGSRVPMIAAAGVGIVVLGIGAGALLAGGGGDDGGGNQPVSATAPASGQPSAPPSPAVDPARQQAVELDKLLAHSGDSRTTVINAVADVKACRNLGQAAKDLREAAQQRNQLVTDLSGLSVDRLPDHAALTTALTEAWKASAAADDHYAAWADQVAGAKGKMCKKGQARATGRTQAGNRASGTATAEKTKASGLWNGIARQYGLTQRQPTQL
ncbi:hypothetical protein SUDANB15_03281 [Streptomyces sp. enrichment culture]|uniref:hypothetical protein n=1 Tax=Streptomyces sp. enrichment culture TaxID=1795815 RepID=UPI003F551B18